MRDPVSTAIQTMPTDWLANEARAFHKEAMSQRNPRDRAGMLRIAIQLLETLADRYTRQWIMQPNPTGGTR